MSRGAVLNGADDRLEVFEAPESVAAPLLEASAAFLYAQHVLESAPASVHLRSIAAAEAVGLCADEPFASEPSVAFCSGVLIDENLVATAGHCFGDAALAASRCRDVRVVFGYALSAPGEAVELAPERVFACRRVVVIDADVAIVQLDRPVIAPLSPRPIASGPRTVGDRLVVASHGSGLPLKIELAAEVTEVASDGALTVAMDTFAGSSGGGLYDDHLDLAALVSGGDIDWDVMDGCARAHHSTMAREHGIAAQHLLQALCDVGWPSLRLCGTEPRCGDTVCSPHEVCSQDCSPARCGDSLCEPIERGACAADCAHFDSVPPSWRDDPASYPMRPGVGAPSSSASAGCSVSTRATSPVPAWPPPVILLAYAARRLGRARAKRWPPTGTRTIRTIAPPTT